MRPDPKRLQMLAAIMEIESEFLEECIWHGALRLEDLPEDRGEFTPSQLARLRRIQRICRGLDIDVFAGCIIVDIVDRMDGLQRELERLRAIADDEPPD